MQVGKLRHRIVIEDYTEAVDSYGEPDKTYSTTATVWASIEPLSGGELFRAQQVQSETTHRVTMRHITITPASRIRFGVRYFDILNIANTEERNAELILLCREAR